MQSKEEKSTNAKLWYESNLLKFNACTEEISKLIEKIINNNDIVFQNISCRVKSEESFLKKCDNDKYNIPEKQITDVIGIRIITYTNKEVRQICKIIEEEFEIDLKNSVNKADSLADNKVGYLSVHFVASLSKQRNKLTEYSQIKNLKFEIQVRTLLQHAWAEIEHDKSYKFSGELRKDLKRNFSLIAGVLELMDQEFEKLSDEIDNYAASVLEETENGNFDIAIDSTSLKEYMKNKFEKYNMEINTIDSDIIKELKDFGLNTLKDIEEIMLLDDILTTDNSYYGILRDIMIINNADKYFNNSYNTENWRGIEYNEIKLYKEYGVDIAPYIKKFDLTLFDESDYV